MAETFGSRFGLRNWGAGTDTPSRSEFNAIFTLLEQQAVGFSSGVIGVRPAAGKGGWVFLEVDGSSVPQNLWYDTGSAWVKVVDLTPTPTYETLIWTMPGELYTRTGKGRIYIEQDSTIIGVRASVGTPSSGAAVVVDVNRSGTTIFSTQSKRPQISVGQYTAVGDMSSPTVTALTGGTHYLTVDVDQVGSSDVARGYDLTVAVRVQVT